ncbi:hypothetical protein, partial [Kitasatospora sp. NPDC056531]|uniref:hypothetical protein n=1 Tax=Kitasatospora sp. NPDC056531 TaxID=3345856 RepID=UPI0036AED9C5
MNTFEYLLGALLNVPVRARDALRERWPGDRRLRALAESPQAQALRAAERERIRRLVEALGAVEGVEHLLTRVADHCDRPSSLGALGTTVEGRAALLCRMAATAYFVTREDMAVVLERVEAAGLADWGSPDGRSGTVAHALRWYRDGALSPEGWRMDSPGLTSPGAYLSWDLPGVPRPDPYWKRLRSSVRFRNEQTPEDADPAAVLSAARADGGGLVLELELRTDWREGCTYYTVARGGPAGRGRGSSPRHPPPPPPRLHPSDTGAAA